MQPSFIIKKTAQKKHPGNYHKAKKNRVCRFHFLAVT